MTKWLYYFIAFCTLCNYNWYHSMAFCTLCNYLLQEFPMSNDLEHAAQTEGIYLKTKVKSEIQLYTVSETFISYMNSCMHSMNKLYQLHVHTGVIRTREAKKLKSHVFIRAEFFFQRTICQNSADFCSQNIANLTTLINKKHSVKYLHFYKATP